jgi:PAS domain S-box-containing protein
MTSILFAVSALKDNMPIMTIVSAMMLLLFCVPLCIVHYRSSNDKTLKIIFLALTITIIGIAISGIFWYLIPARFDSNLLIPIGMLFMIMSYLPLIFGLYRIYKKEKNNLNSQITQFVIYLNIIFFLFSIYYIIINIQNNVDDIDNIIVFYLSVIGDTIIISLSTILLLNSLPIKHRFIFSIIFGFSFLSLLGDTSQLLAFLNLYDTSSYSQICYDVMLIILSASLLIYSLVNVKTTSIEEVNKKLQDTTMVVDDLLMQSPDAMCMCDVNGLAIKVNNPFLTTFNLEKNQVVGIMNIFDYDYSFEYDVKPIFSKLKNGETIYIDSIKYINSLESKYLSIKLFPTYSSDNKLLHYILITEDITTRKNAVDALKTANDELEDRVKARTSELSILNLALQNEIIEHKADEERIKTSLKEKEVLLKEIHHRVKNNMQIISSILGLQSSYVKERYFNDILRDCQNRIKSMALIHEKLYQSENLANVKIKDYVGSIVNNLYSSYGYNRDTISITTDVEDLFVDIDIAIPLGLIINELVSNSFKHAFPDNRIGEIYINLKKQDNNKYELIVRDNGVGFPGGFDVNTSNTLGLQLVKVLVDQLGGDITITNGTGVSNLIHFYYNK